MTRAIITGPTGAIGTALIEELVSNNVEVLAIVRPDSERKQNIKKSPLVSVLECSLDSLSELKNKTGKVFDVFYHFAWMGTTGKVRNDMLLQNANVKFALDAVTSAKEFGCNRFVFAGSQAEYGRYNGKLTAETPCFPENGYGIAKLCAENMTRIYAEQLEIEHIATRILSVYGPNDGTNTLISSLVYKLKNNIPVDTTAGEQIWDYLYSDDAGKAMRLLGEKGISGKTYVLGSGNARPLKDYILEAKAIINRDCPVNFGAIPYASNQVMHLEADISDLTNDTGWMPETGFEEGIKRIFLA